MAALWLAACGSDAGSELFGTKVAPPGILAEIRPDLSLADLKKLAPNASEVPAMGWVVGRPARNATAYALVLDDAVTHTYIDWHPANLVEVLTHAWGPPDRDGIWRSTETGWRASVQCNAKAEQPWCQVDFHTHQPLEAMFTTPIRPPGDMARARDRIPLEELKRITP
ncbi:MAG TPA: hypothetical protein VGC41_23865, partial [Kofleriaceae bacterium]